MIAPVALFLLLFMHAGASTAAQAPLGLDEVFAATPPWGAQPSRVLWAPQGSSFLYVTPSQDPFEALPVRQYDLRTRQTRIVIDPRAYGRRAGTPRDLAWSPDGTRIAFIEGDVLYVRDLSTNLDRKIDKGASGAQWSPSGNEIAYVRGADLYVASMGRRLSVRRLTTGGLENTVLNGGLDWVYPEELSTAHGFAWSGDGTAIAYMRLDERPVTAFPIVDFLAHDNTVGYERYPLAGEKNPRASLFVLYLNARRPQLVYDAARRDEYIPFFGWKPRSHVLLAELLDRAQQHLRVLAWSEKSRTPSMLYAQSDAKWVDDVPLPLWSSAGTSLWLLDRDGTNGIYLRDSTGGLKRITGSYHAFSLLGVNWKRHVAYVTAAYPTRRDRSLLAVPLDAGPPSNLTAASGTHGVSLDPTFARFVDTYSTLNDPPSTNLVDVAAPAMVTVLAPRSERLRAQMLPTEMLSVDSPYGKLDATMLRPPNFIQARRYPVIVYVYGGPAAPTTTDGFGEQRELYHQLLAQRGFIVFSIDGPASQIDSDKNVRLLYHNFGPGSLLGQKIGVSYLRSLPYVDPRRIGVWGWSFGGYETAYALTHSDLFAAGAAVAPVTDWHLYDSIYTERYMGLPQANPAAYDASSVITAAGKLRAPLLISHGTSDDNVHMANTISLLQAFVESDRTGVDFMVYPRRTHSIAGLAQRRHLYEHMLDWWTRHL